MLESSTPLPPPTSHHPPVPHTNHRHKREKRRAYEQRILQMEHGIFTPLILSTGTLHLGCLQETGRLNCHQARTRWFMVHQIYGIRYSTPCTQCLIQAFKPLSGASLQATFWQAQYQCRCPQIGQSLIQCQHSKMYRYTITPTGYFSQPDVQFDLVHNDIVGPLPSAKDNMHLLTCVHRFAFGHTIARHFHRVNRTSLSRVG